MSSVVAGMFGAWALVHLVLGTFFLVAPASEHDRREARAFGLGFVAAAVAVAALAVAAVAATPAAWLRASHLALAAAAVATQANLVFVQAASGAAPRVASRVAGVGSLLVVGVCAIEGVWYPETARLQSAAGLGGRLDGHVATLTPVGLSAIAFVLGVVVFSLALLVGSYRRGDRDLGAATLGFGAVLLCGVADIVSMSLELGIPPLFPFGNVVYGAGVAATLLARARTAAATVSATAERLHKASEELAVSYMHLSAMQEELFRRRQLASVGEFAATMAHEVRNPLAIIGNAAATLRRATTRPEDRETLFDIIEEEIHRLNRLVTELLQFARPVQPKWQPSSVAELVRVAVLDAAPSRTVSVDVAPDAETASLDPTLVRVALTKLIENAAQATEGGGELRVVARRVALAEGSRLELRVEDGGAGMDAATAARAQDPFFSTRPSGTGLGLPIAGRIAAAHGGTLTLESEEGGGTRVALLLPTEPPSAESAVFARQPA